MREVKRANHPPASRLRRGRRMEANEHEFWYVKLATADYTDFTNLLITPDDIVVRTIVAEEIFEQKATKITKG
jgi:hypothetical protein